MLFWLWVFLINAVKALNQARLEANVRVYGAEDNFKQKWPSPYAIASGLFLLLSLFKYVYRPLGWLALGAVAVGIFPIAMKGIASIRNFRLDINILMIVAGTALQFQNFLSYNFSFKISLLHFPLM